VQKVLGDFIHALRHDGLPISPSETLDALNAAKLIGLHHPQILKGALATTLAKSVAHQAQLSVLFDKFFSIHSLAAKNKDEQSNQKNTPHEQNSEEANTTAIENDTQKSPKPENHSAIKSALAQQLLNDDQTALQMAINAAAEDAGAAKMQIFTQQPVVSMRIMTALGDNQLNKELSELAKEDGNGALVEVLRKKQQRLRQQVKGYVEQQYLLYSKNNSLQLREEHLQKIKLSNIDISQYQLMLRLVKQAAKKLASVHSRRQKVSKRGILDVRKTIAANAAFDGFLFHTKWKSTRIERPKVFVLCDVSGSVSRTARFLLLFLYSLQDVLPKVRSFVFASDLAEVTDSFKTLDLESAITDIMNSRANMSTDYGHALRDFNELAVQDIDNKTTVIMLGDARNNYGDSNADVWKNVYQRSKRVLWLNPEGHHSWDSGDSIMSEYSPYCSRVEHCSSLRDLTRILGSLLKQS
jgi:uncharacterized protein with von Willebrand factor type A (vWA) domain